jgi:solute carrier family 35 (UDP-sugar transporter), member A1/2/3
MHYSRVSIPASQAYSPAAAVLMNEVLKGAISFVIALSSVVQNATLPHVGTGSALAQVMKDIFSPDCWKLSIPAILYVIQNSLQFVAVSNLPVASFQVSYQMKILTTAAFSVALLRKSLSRTQWASLFFLALGVAVVQLQSGASHHHSSPSSSSSGTNGKEQQYVPASAQTHVMDPWKGFGAVVAACFTSGLAGVYFEMVLKGSKADLWVRNVQLSLFSLLPALLPVLMPGGAGPTPGSGLFANFGGWAWATVAIQVAGGLVTAVVIKYSDNIMKGFATSLSIVISFLASVALFNFTITPSFVVGASMVLSATYTYNAPAESLPPMPRVLSRAPSPKHGFSPVRGDEPIIGEVKRKSSTTTFGSPRVFASALGLGGGEKLAPATTDTARYLSAPYGSPFASPWGSPLPSRSPSPQPPPPPPRANSVRRDSHD